MAFFLSNLVSLEFTKDSKTFIAGLAVSHKGLSENCGELGKHTVEICLLRANNRVWCLADNSTQLNNLKWGISILQSHIDHEITSVPCVVITPIGKVLRKNFENAVTCTFYSYIIYIYSCTSIGTKRIKCLPVQNITNSTKMPTKSQIFSCDCNKTIINTLQLLMPAAAVMV